MTETFLGVKYNRNDFISFLSQKFLPTDFEQSIENIKIDNTNGKINQAIKLGSCDSLDLSIYEFRHSSSKDPRVSLSRECFNILGKYDYQPNALAVFYNEEAKQWRLSLITSDYIQGKKKGRVKQEMSNPRRFSYFVGEECKLHTPSKFILGLGQIREQTRNSKKYSAIEDLISRFSVEVLTDEFYDRLYDWYIWALEIVRFPEGISRDVKLTSNNNDTHLIRLITRLIFVWFIKQKDLIPDWIFDKNELNKIMNNFNPESKKTGNYYNGILQNLFFATLNREIPDRSFTSDTNELGNQQFGVNHFYRDRKGDSYFKITQDEVLKKFSDIPFLNGGLFECLDQIYDNPKKPGTAVQEYCDGFSREKSRCAFIPDILFFNDENKGKTAGIISLLELYNFTVEENTPVDVDVALDPELLGKVFEELLGVYNEETQTTVRKETGSYYTPREIVDYMATESLKNYLYEYTKDFIKENSVIEALFSYSKELPVVNSETKKLLIKAIDECKIIDPACGSGAFPMGILNKLSHVLSKLDNEGNLWKERQIERAQQEAKNAISIDDEAERDKKLKEISKTLDLNKSEYGHKLYLIENCLYGVDIKQIAIQITKLRFFISLVVEQEKDAAKPNFGIRPLPNLETKFVCANTLFGLDKANQDALALEDDKITAMKERLWNIRQQHFYAPDLKTKKDHRKKDNEIRNEIKEYLLNNAAKPNEQLIDQLTTEIVRLEIARDDVSDEKWVDLSADTGVLFNTLTNALPIMIDKNQKKRKKIDEEISRLSAQIQKEYKKGDSQVIQVDIDKIANWDPYDQNSNAADFFDPFWMFNIKDGFDIVIGNPPYVRQERLGQEFKKLLADNYPDIANGTADLYVYFFGAGLKYLKYNGFLSFITGNKYLKTKYGLELRNELALKYDVLSIIDFFELPVFKASTDTSIINIANRNQIKDTKYYPVKTLKNLNLFELTSSEYQKVIKDASEWKFINLSEESILNKIYIDSISLKDFVNDKIYSGIKTAFNEAFILDDVNAKLLLKSESKAIIKPYAKSTDIEKYNLKNKNRYFLATGYDIDVKRKYPTAYKFLKQYESKLKARLDKGLNWWNLRPCAYYQDFELPKIIYIHTAVNHQFYLDTEGRYINNSCYMIISDSKYLFAFLNSKLFEWLKKIKFVAYGDASESGRAKLDYNKMITVPIKNISNSKQKPVISLVEKITSKKQENPDADTSKLERLLENVIYRLYDLSYEEVKAIEPDFPLSKAEYEEINYG